MENRKEIKKTFNSILQKQIPQVFSQGGENIKVGVVVAYDSKTRYSTIRIKTNGKVVNGARLAKSIGTLKIGDEVVILSIDAKFSSRNYVIACFGGNYADTEVVVGA